MKFKNTKYFKFEIFELKKMSIFNFKRRANKPYELGERIGGGLSCDFYKIKDKKILGIKIFDNTRVKLKWKEQEKCFKRDFEIGNLLRRNGIPTPRYVGIISINNPDNNVVEKGLAMEIIGDEVLIKPSIVEHNYIYFIPEEIKISELGLSQNRDIKEAISRTLNLMINNLGISKEELIKKLKRVDFQGLY